MINPRSTHSPYQANLLELEYLSLKRSACCFALLMIFAGCSPPSTRTKDPGDPAKPVLTILVPIPSKQSRELVFSPDGTRLAAGEVAGGPSITVWDSTTGQQLLRWPAHTTSISGLAFTPDGKQLVSASYDNTIKIWDASSGELTRTIEPGMMPLSLALSPQGDLIACGGSSHYTSGVGINPDTGAPNPGMHSAPIKIWDFTTGEEVKELIIEKIAGGMKELAFNPAGDQLVSASYNNHRITVWSLPAGEILHTFPGHDFGEGISCLAYSLDGKRIASGSHNLTVKIWSAETGEELKAWGKKGILGRVQSVEFTPDGKQIATASGFGVHLWDPTTGQRLRTLKDLNRRENVTLGGAPPVGSSLGGSFKATFSPDGRRLACVFSEKIIIWDMQ